MYFFSIMEFNIADATPPLPIMENSTIYFLKWNVVLVLPVSYIRVNGIKKYIAWTKVILFRQNIRTSGMWVEEWQTVSGIHLAVARWWGWVVQWRWKQSAAWTELGDQGWLWSKPPENDIVWTECWREARWHHGSTSASPEMTKKCHIDYSRAPLSCSPQPTPWLAWRNSRVDIHSRTHRGACKKI